MFLRRLRAPLHSRHNPSSRLSFLSTSHGTLMHSSSSVKGFIPVEDLHPNFSSSLHSGALAVRKEGQGSTVSSDENLKSGFRLAAAVILERLPVILPEPPSWAVEYENFSFEVRQRHRKVYPKEFLEAASSSLADEDGRDKSIGFEAAPRRTAADEANDVRSLQRALDRRLYFIVQGVSPLSQSGDATWHFPEKQYVDEPTMRLCAEETLKSKIGSSLQTYFVGNAPCAHRPIPGSPPQTTFYFRSQVLGGKLKLEDKNIKDYAWVTKDELQNFISLSDEESKLFEHLLS